MGLVRTQTQLSLGRRDYVNLWSWAHVLLVHTGFGEWPLNLRTGHFFFFLNMLPVARVFCKRRKAPGQELPSLCNSLDCNSQNYICWWLLFKKSGGRWPVPPGITLQWEFCSLSSRRMGKKTTRGLMVGSGGLVCMGSVYFCLWDRGSCSPYSSGNWQSIGGWHWTCNCSASLCRMLR